MEMTTEELEIWKRLNELPEVKAVFGKYWFVGDLCIIDRKGTIHTCHYNNHIKDFHAIWIPPLYDPIRPERSLWGIFKDIVLELNSGWDENAESLNDWVNRHIGMVSGSNGNRPDLALAKAIIEQEENDGAEI